MNIVFNYVIGQQTFSYRDNNECKLALYLYPLLNVIS